MNPSPAMLPRLRCYPPIGYYDTVSIKNGSIVSIHGNQTIFKDREIKEVHLSIPASGELVIQINELGKNLLQQQGARGCTAAVAAMLLLDSGKPFNQEALYDTNLAEDAFILSLLEEGGLKPFCSYPPPQSDPRIWLIKTIQDRGSAIVTVEGDFGSHVVIVDEIFKDADVRIREPYHGWDITLKTAAFMKYWQRLSPVIQIDQP